MRISDWSSDVCSSDLHYRGTAKQHRHRPDDHRVRRWRPGGTRTRPGSHAGRQCGYDTDRSGMVVQSDRPGAGSHTCRCLAVPAASARAAPTPGPGVTDRKSVVSGKSVSVRVELGVRWSIKNKTKQS